MKNSKTHRLPGYDSRTHQSELLAFSGLAVVGAVLIVSAVSNSVKFAQAREQIGTLSQPISPQVLTARGPSQELTNALRSRAASLPCHELIRTRSTATQAQPM